MLLSEELVGKAFEIANRERDNARMAFYRFNHPEKERQKWKLRTIYRRNHHEEYLEREKRYRAKHRDHLRESGKINYQKHCEARKELQRKYRSQHREQANALVKKWRESHPGYQRKLYWSDPHRYRLYTRKRVSLKKTTTKDPLAIEHFMNRVLGLKTILCHWCGKRVSTKKIHFDHVIPISKGGIHSVENLCVSCAFCNLSKNDNFPNQFAVKGQLHLNL